MKNIFKNNNKNLIINSIFILLIILNLGIFLLLLNKHRNTNTKFSDIKINKIEIEKDNQEKTDEKIINEKVINTEDNKNIISVDEYKNIFILNKNEITRIKLSHNIDNNLEQIKHISNSVYKLFNYENYKEGLENVDKNFNDKIKDLMFFGYKGFNEEQLKSSNTKSQENIRIFIEPLYNNKYSVYIFLPESEGIKANFYYFKITYKDNGKLEVVDNYIGIFDKEKVYD